MGGNQGLQSCPHCGEMYRAGRLNCPHCGSDTETGWSEDAITGYTEALPEDFTDEDYESVLRGIAGYEPPRRPRLGRRELYLLVVGLIAVAAIVFAYVL